MQIVVAPNGVAVPLEVQEAAQNPPLLMSLAGIAGSLVRASVEVAQPVEVGVQVARADDVAIVWMIGPWVLHASDLRAGTLGMYCEMVRKARAKSGMANLMGMNNAGVSVPRYVMSLLVQDEGIPVGIIVQSTAQEPPLPMLELQLDGSLQSAWLMSVHFNLVARIGEAALRAALADVATVRAGTTDFGAFIDRVPSTLAPHHIADDEAIACLVLDQWEREKGGDRMKAFRALVRA